MEPVSSDHSDVRESFAEIAARYRTRSFYSRILAAFLVLIFFVEALVWPWTFTTLFTSLVMLVVLLLSGGAIPKLICPACRRDAASEIVRFCPECGSQEVQTKAEGKFLFLGPLCKKCGAK